MKKKNLVTLFLTATIVFAACNNRDENGSTDTSNTNSTKSSTDNTRGDKPSDTSSTTANTVTDKESTDFVMKATSGGMMEIEAGKLAQQNAKSQQVKDFGSMMVTDHSKANDELKSVASSKKIPIPAAMMPDEQKHIDMMSKMKGADFDKHYMNMMLDDHKNDVAEFERASKSLKDSDLRSFAKKTLPVLEKHLNSAQAIQGKM